jgi:DNA-binding transcriptional LysR family regulator
MLPDLESLRCFEAAATHLNFRVAAKAVALSPAALGERIRRLEETLGASLFERTTRRVALTSPGTKLLVQARRTLEAARRCLGAVRDGDAALPWELTLGTRFELGLSFLTPALPELEARRPERTVHLFFADSPELFARLKKGTIDCAMHSARIISGGFQYELLHDESYVFVASAALVNKHPPKSPKHAPGHVLLDISPDLPLFRYFLDTWHHDAPWTFARTEYLGTIGAIRLRLLQGTGVAVLPRYFVAPDLAKGKIVTLLPRTKPKADAFRLMWRKGHHLEAEIRQLAAELRARPLT